jgi:cytosine/adenosine deaminase-related metal-dependent hydrolase
VTSCRHPWQALIAPGFIDLDALADLDTTILGFDNQPGWRKGRVWPQSYMDRGPVEMYGVEELAFQKRYAFAQLLRNGITTALPIASLFYREWGETAEEFAAAADIAGDLGLRVYLGPAYRSGNQVVDASGTIGAYFDEARGLSGLETAIAFCRAHEGRHGGLVRTSWRPIGSKPARRNCSCTARARLSWTCRCDCIAVNRASSTRWS